MLHKNSAYLNSSTNIFVVILISRHVGHENKQTFLLIMIIIALKTVNSFKYVFIFETQVFLETAPNSSCE